MSRIIENVGNVVVQQESERANVFISSLLYSRATVFHPTPSLTIAMKKRLVEIAEAGGTNFDTPLGSSTINSYGTTYKVNLYVDFLLQPHRDVLDTLLAYGTKITLDKSSLESGSLFTWSQVLSTIPNLNVLSQNHPYDIIDDRTSIVLSMSMWELASRMGLTPHTTVYKVIEDRIAKLYSAFLTVSELDDAGNELNRAPLRFVKDFRICYDPAKNKNGKSRVTSPNHVFVILERSLLRSIKEHGYFLREEQYLMAHYKQPSVRSFLKYLKTHRNEFSSGKKLDWMLKQYVGTLAFPVGIRFTKTLKQYLLSDKVRQQIEFDFGIQILSEQGSCILRYVGPIEIEAIQ